MNLKVTTQPQKHPTKDQNQNNKTNQTNPHTTPLKLQTHDFIHLFFWIQLRALATTAFLKLFWEMCIYAKVKNEQGK